MKARPRRKAKAKAKAKAVRWTGVLDLASGRRFGSVAAAANALGVPYATMHKWTRNAASRFVVVRNKPADEEAEHMAMVAEAVRRAPAEGWHLTSADIARALIRRRAAAR